MNGVVLLRRDRSRRLAWLGMLLLAVWGLLGGCSDDAPPRDDHAVTGKTPVVRPEDLYNQATGTAVLAPDYRSAVHPEETAAENAGLVARGGEPAAPRLFDRSREASPQAPADNRRGVAPGAFPDADCRQLVVVVPGGAARQGVLRRLARERADEPWLSVGDSAPCALGRQGLGLGRGLALTLPLPPKREGDGRTPAGLFPLAEAFGYATPDAAKTRGVRLPYVEVADRTACVTDPTSPLFGHIVGPDKRGTVRQDRMYRADGANRWGVVIGHNRADVDPAAGSCVFINVRVAGGPPTGGSIGIPEAAAAGLVAWLDPAARPLLLVVPETVYQALKTAWKLP